MSSYTADSRPYHQILHVLLHGSDHDWDEDNCVQSILWVRDHSETLRRVLSQPERRVLKLVTDYFWAHKSTPTVAGLDELIREQQRNQEMLDELEEYRAAAPDLGQVPYTDLGVYLDQRKADAEKARVGLALETAGRIVVGSEKVHYRGKDIPYTGPSDALKYVQQRIQDGLLFVQRPTPGGDTAVEGAASLLSRYDLACEGRHDQIETGLPPLDEALSIGHAQGNRIKFVGIAGFTGHGKSTLLFSLVYRAALQGNRVLLVPRECSVEQAWDHLIYLHAHQIGLAAKLPPLKHLLRPRYARAECRAVLNEVVADFQRRGLRIDVRADRTWAEVEASVQAHINDPYDILAVDYLAHLQLPPDTRSGYETSSLLEYFRRAQALSQDYEDGRGLVIITPMQTNKSSATKAGEGDLLAKGAYHDVGCLEQLTGAGRDMDALIGIWSTDEHRECGLAKISCIKSRDNVFRPFYLKLDKHSQAMTHVPDSEAIRMLGEVAPTGLEANPVAARRKQKPKYRSGSSRTANQEMNVEDII